LPVGRFSLALPCLGFILLPRLGFSLVVLCYVSFSTHSLLLVSFSSRRFSPPSFTSRFPPPGGNVNFFFFLSRGSVFPRRGFIPSLPVFCGCAGVLAPLLWVCPLPAPWPPQTPQKVVKTHPGLFPALFPRRSKAAAGHGEGKVPPPVNQLLFFFFLFCRHGPALFYQPTSIFHKLSTTLPPP